MQSFRFHRNDNVKTIVRLLIFDIFFQKVLMFFDNYTIVLPTKTHWMGEFMKRFILEHSDEEFYTATSGIQGG